MYSSREFRNDLMKNRRFNTAYVYRLHINQIFTTSSSKIDSRVFLSIFCVIINTDIPLTSTDNISIKYAFLFFFLFRQKIKALLFYKTIIHSISIIPWPTGSGYDLPAPVNPKWRRRPESLARILSRRHDLTPPLPLAIFWQKPHK